MKRRLQRLAPLTFLPLWAALAQPTVALAQPTSGLVRAAPPAPAAIVPHRGDTLRIALVTFGQGDGVHQYFGHDALLIEDTLTGRRSLYNFGMFSFGPTMLANFLYGRLTFWVAEMPVPPIYQFYRSMRRSIRVQDLDLSGEAKLRVAQALADNVLPENREYLYHHYYDNCATRLRDIIDLAVDGQLKPALSEPSLYTYRGHTRRYTQHDPFIDVGLQFMMNDSMEEAITLWDQAFLPRELANLIADFEYTDAQGARRRLVARDIDVYNSGRPAIPDAPYRQWPRTLLLGCLIGAVALASARFHARARRRLSRMVLGLLHVVYGLVFGVPGLLGALCWAFTEHAVTFRNENMWLANPITFTLLPLGVAIASGWTRALPWAARASQAIVIVSLLGVASKLLPAFDQDNWVVMSLILPANLGLLWAHRVLNSTALEAAEPAAQVDA